MAGPFEHEAGNQFRQARYASRTSALAVLSLISGIVSFPMMCCLIVSIPFSVFAIVCGHLSRGIIRQSRGEYAGTEMATFGLLMGYVSLILMGGVLLYGVRTVDDVIQTVSPSKTPAADVGAVLLQQAEQTLQNEMTVYAGSSTTKAEATALARHVVETLEVFDRTHLEAAESLPDQEAEAAQPPQTTYRAFAQINADSIAVLIHVAELPRFTDDARILLQERCWLIVQRSVDDLLPENANLAVAIYGPDNDGPGKASSILIGHTQRSGDALAGLQTDSGSRQQLQAFFRLSGRHPEAAANQPGPDAEAVAAEDAGSPIDARPLPDGLPAEVE